jgi:hypothetical protein
LGSGFSEITTLAANEGPISQAAPVGAVSSRAGRDSSGSLLAVLVFVLVASLSLAAGSSLQRLAFADGAADGGEWFSLGRNLAVFGVLGEGHEPVLHRPPGYPLWVALILKVAVDPSTHTEAVVGILGPIALQVADSFLLGLASLFLFVWLARRLRLSTAFVAALLFGANPYAVVSTTLLHYGTLQWTLLLGLILYFDGAFAAVKSDALGRFFVGGLLLGLVTLVRPVTLLVPLFFLPLLVSRQAPRRGGWRYAALVAGMCLAIAPWTARNLSLTGRFIPVNAQGWNALFASTSVVAEHNPDRYEWGLLTLRYYMPIYRRVTGEAEHSLPTYRRNIVALEDAAREAAIHNIVSKPAVYLTNMAKAALGLNRDVNAVLLTAFTRIQTGEPFDRRWFYIGVRRAIGRGAEADVFQGLHNLLLGASLLGVGIAVRRKDFFLAPALALWGAIVAVYSLTYLDFFYYAVKMPFLVAFAFYGLDALPRPFRYGLIGGVAVLSLALSWSMRLLG